MKSVSCLLALSLSGCIATPILTYASCELEAGYPVFVGSKGSDCLFQIQDMIVNRRQLSEWMRDLPDKSRRVDLVVDNGAGSCASRADRTVRNAGFVEIAFRRRGDADYPSGIPPA